MKLNTFFVFAIFSFASSMVFAKADCGSLFDNGPQVNGKADINEILSPKGEKYKSTLHKSVDRGTYIKICQANQAKRYSA